MVAVCSARGYGKLMKGCQADMIRESEKKWTNVYN